VPSSVDGYDCDLVSFLHDRSVNGSLAIDGPNDETGDLESSIGEAIAAHPHIGAVRPSYDLGLGTAQAYRPGAGWTILTNDNAFLAIGPKHGNGSAHGVGRDVGGAGVDAAVTRLGARQTGDGKHRRNPQMDDEHSHATPFRHDGGTYEHNRPSTARTEHGPSGFLRKRPAVRLLPEGVAMTRTHSPRFRLAFIVVAVLSSGVHRLNAQTGRPAPYSRLTVRASALAAPRATPVSDYYRVSEGESFGLDIPFEVGILGVTVDLFSLTGDAQASRPNMKAAVAALEWRFGIVSRGPFRIDIGGQLGDFLINYADTIPVARRTYEGELLAGVTGQVSLRLWRHFGIEAHGAHSKIFYTVPVRLTTAGAGVTFTTNTPAWLQAFFR
jgi:hypothetical protein